jgi:hypothetical protein
MVFTIAQFHLRSVDGDNTPIDQIDDPMKRLKAIQDAQIWLNQKSPDGSDSKDIKFVRQLVGVSGEPSLETSLRSQMGWYNRQYDTLHDSWKAFFVEHLNEINLVNLARFEDEQAIQAQKKGRLFGSKQDDEWLPKVLKMNGFTESDGLLLPKDMDEEAKNEYLSAFEAYRQLFSEKNTSERQRLNEAQLKATEELEGLIAEYENIEQTRYKTGEFASRETNAQSHYNDIVRSLADARGGVATAEMRVRDANFFNRGARERELKDLQDEIANHEQWLLEATQQLSEAQAQHQKVKNAPQELASLEQQFQRRGHSKYKEEVKRHIEESKNLPKY